MSPGEAQQSGERASTGSRVATILILVLLGAALVWGAIALAPHLSREKMEAWVRGAGVWGPLLLLGIQAAQILAAPIPGVFVPVVAGILYGPLLGPALTVAGSLIGATAAYWIGRSGQPLAERLLGTEALRKAQNLMRGRRWIGLATLFLIPFTPADALCFVAGIVAMKWRLFLYAVLLGRVPKDAVVSAAAALGFRLFD